MEPVTFFVFSKKTCFIPNKFLYPECEVLLQPYPQAYLMQCFQTSCPANKSCGETIAHRVHYLFEKVVPKEVELIISYYKWRDRPNSVRGVTFWKDLREPTVMILNRSGFDKFRKEGIVYTWQPTSEYLYIGKSSNIVPVENLIHGRNKNKM